MDELEIFEYQKDSIFKLIKEALSSSTQAKELLLEDIDSKDNETLAALLVGNALSSINTAQAIYVSNIKSLDRHELEEIFERFNEFQSEFFENITSDHSHQWTFIEYDAFKDSVEVFIP